jgi:hypothetical protein
MFGLTEHGSVWWIAAAPIFVWELSLGIYLIVKGFKSCPITDALTAPAAQPADV